MGSSLDSPGGTEGGGKEHIYERSTVQSQGRREIVPFASRIRGVCRHCAETSWRGDKHRLCHFYVKSEEAKLKRQTAGVVTRGQCLGEPRLTWVRKILEPADQISPGRLYPEQ